MNQRRDISGPRLGLNMHPKWVEGGSPETFLFPLREVGLRVLEFPMDLLVSNREEMDRLISACRRLQFAVSFHAPYGGRYNVARFLGPEREDIQRLFEPVIGYAAAIACEDGPTTLVVHGAKARGGRRAMKKATRRFIDWLGERWPGISPTLELRVLEPGVVKIGDRKSELLDVVAHCRNPRVGICWDLGHDALNGSLVAPPRFVERVTHVHVHDLSPTGEDHYPLLFGNAPYHNRLEELYRAGYSGDLILEVDGYSIVRLARERSISHMTILRESLLRLAASLSVRS